MTEQCAFIRPVMERGVSGGGVRRCMLLATAVMSPFWGQPAMAQDAPSAGSTEQTQASTSALREEASGDIVVTARLREERLQDAPVTVTAVGGDVLSKGMIADVRDIRNVVPNLGLSELSSGALRISLRGVVNTSPFINEDPEVVVNVDGVVLARPEFQNLSFFDLDRVEVLRGPQGTLYGRNSTGGALNLITARPTRDLTGFVTLNAGNYDLARIEAAISGPVTDWMQARVAMTATHRSGYGINIFTGNDVTDDRRYAVRGQLNFDIAPDVTFRLSTEHAVEDDNSGQSSFVRETFPGAIDTRLRASGVGGFANPRSRNVAGNVDPLLHRDFWAVAGTLDWRISDSLRVTSITAYRDGFTYVLQDFDWSTVVSGIAANGFPGTITYSDSRADQVSQEVRLNFQLDVLGRQLEGVAGLFYFDENILSTNTLGVTRFVGEGGGAPRIIATGVADTTAYAAFWNVSYDIVDWLRIRAGGRYTKEDKAIDNRILTRTGGGVGPQIVNDSTATVRIPADDAKTFRAYTNEFGIDIRPMEDILLYYTYSEGFRSGGGLLGQIDSGIIRPTTVENHEAGIKSQWFDHALTVNLAAFDADYTDVQRRGNFPNPLSPLGFSQFFENATSLRSRGVELEYLVNLGRLRVAGSVAYLDTRYGRYVTTDPLDPNVVLAPALALKNVEGNEAPLAPNWRASLRPEVDLPVFSRGTLTLGANVIYTGKQFFSDFNDPLLSEDNYVLFDLNLTYRSSDDRLSVGIWGRNLTDELRRSGMEVSSVGRVINQYWMPPRTFGATVGYRF